MLRSLRRQQREQQATWPYRQHDNGRLKQWMRLSRLNNAYYALNDASNQPQHAAQHQLKKVKTDNGGRVSL